MSVERESTTAVRSAGRRVVAWRPLIRALHWTIAATTVALLATGKAEAKDAHLLLGPVLLLAVLARVWVGFTGISHERFRRFFSSPRLVLAQLKATVVGGEKRTIGHNPLAGPVMFLIIAALLANALLGEFLRAADVRQGPLAAVLSGASAEVVDAVAVVHAGLAQGVLMLLLLHFAGLAAHALRHRENIVKAMITGEKEVDDVNKQEQP